MGWTPVFAANRHPRNGAWRGRDPLERPPVLHGRTAPIGGRLRVTPLDLTDAEFAFKSSECSVDRFVHGPLFV
jgi:hypothetical protein